MEISEKTCVGLPMDHLGLIAATIEDLGLIALIDRKLPLDPKMGSKVTMGQRVAAMILNGLGFTNTRLYMFPDFLQKKPVHRLFNPDVKAEDFNDDALGRCLDAMYKYGVTKLFSEIAVEIKLRLKITGKSIHVDTTTLSLYGAYPGSKVSDEEDEYMDPSDLILGIPCHGYAKNKRMDLKQMVLLLATVGKMGFPLWMEPHSGNASDKKTLHASIVRMKQFYEFLKEAPDDLMFVADSAAYESCIL